MIFIIYILCSVIFDMSLKTFPNWEKKNYAKDPASYSRVSRVFNTSIWRYKKVAEDNIIFIKSVINYTLHTIFIRIYNFTHNFLFCYPTFLQK